MYILDINPIILSLGPFVVRWYSLFYLLGFVFLYAALRYSAKKEWISGLEGENVEKFLVYVILGVVIGSRLGYFLFYNFSGLFSLEIFKIWNGGLSFHGGLIGIITAILLFVKRNNVNLLKLLNISAVVGIFGLALGRIGNFINGRLIGTAFDGGWCVVFPAVDNVCRHPYPIYAFISHILLFSYLILLIYLHRKEVGDFLGRLTLTANFIIGYGLLRIITDIWKVDNMFLGVKTGQWLSAVMILIGIFLLKRRK